MSTLNHVVNYGKSAVSFFLEALEASSRSEETRTLAATPTSASECWRCGKPLRSVPDSLTRECEYECERDVRYF